MDGLFSYYGGDLAGTSQENHPLAHEDLDIPSPDGVEAQISLVIDMGDHDPDFVYVAGEHEPWRTTGAEAGERISRHIRLD
jgi:hypothetical protein